MGIQETHFMIKKAKTKLRSLHVKNNAHYQSQNSGSGTFWLVINKGLGGFVLTLDSCLQPLPCEGKMVRTTIRCPSYYCLESLTLFFCISQSFHPGRLNSDSTFSLKPPLTRAGQPENLFSKPPAPGFPAQINQHKGAVL